MKHLHRLSKRSLTWRIMGIIALSVAVSAWFVLDAAKSLHHETAMEQVKKQALVHLHSLQRDLQRVSRTSAGISSYREVLLQGLQSGNKAFDFSILDLNLYDRTGNRLVSIDSENGGTTASLPTGHAAHSMHHGMQVFSGGHDHLGGDLIQKHDARSGRTISRIHLTVPVTVSGEVSMALEASLDLEETMQRMALTDDTFEQKILFSVAGFTALSLLIIAIVIHRGLLQPVRELGNVTKRITDGDLTARTQTSGDDELGVLGQSVNRMAESIETLIREEEEAYMAALRSLAKALEAKDAYTAGHSSRVTKYSLRLGQRIGLPEEKLSLLKRGAMMHDLGKIGIPDAILNKPAALTKKEFAIMKEHPVMTAEIMKPLKRFREFVEIAAWHHERWDGNGYPDGLKGEDIPLLARIVAIADTWDAMTGDRVYRKGMPQEKALAIMEKERDSGQWDPHLTGQFIQMMQEEIASPQEPEQQQIAHH